MFFTEKYFQERPQDNDVQVPQESEAQAAASAEQKIYDEIDKMCGNFNNKVIVKPTRPRYSRELGSTSFSHFTPAENYFPEKEGYVITSFIEVFRWLMVDENAFEDSFIELDGEFYEPIEEREKIESSLNSKIWIQVKDDSLTDGEWVQATYKEIGQSFSLDSVMDHDSVPFSMIFSRERALTPEELAIYHEGPLDDEDEEELTDEEYHMQWIDDTKDELGITDTQAEALSILFDQFSSGNVNSYPNSLVEKLNAVEDRTNFGNFYTAIAEWVTVNPEECEKIFLNKK